MLEQKLSGTCERGSGKKYHDVPQWSRMLSGIKDVGG
jgi:hypothetical protein